MNRAEELKRYRSKRSRSCNETLLVGTVLTARSNCKSQFRSTRTEPVTVAARALVRRKHRDDVKTRMLFFDYDLPDSRQVKQPPFQPGALLLRQASFSDVEGDTDRMN